MMVLLFDGVGAANTMDGFTIRSAHFDHSIE